LNILNVEVTKLEIKKTEEIIFSPFLLHVGSLKFAIKVKTSEKILAIQVLHLKIYWFHSDAHARV
jgi:hypothetical protein